MFLALDLAQLVLKPAFPRLDKAGALEIRDKGVGRGSLVEVGEEAVDVCAADAEVFELGFEEADVVGGGDVGWGLG